MGNHQFPQHHSITNQNLNVNTNYNYNFINNVSNRPGMINLPNFGGNMENMWNMENMGNMRNMGTMWSIPNMGNMGNLQNIGNIGNMGSMSFMGNFNNFNNKFINQNLFNSNFKTFYSNIESSPIKNSKQILDFIDFNKSYCNFNLLLKSLTFNSLLQTCVSNSSINLYQITDSLEYISAFGLVITLFKDSNLFN